MTDLTEAARILATEASARRALREAKARAYLAYTGGGMKSAEAWQQVALDTAREQAAWDAANNERLLLWLNAGVIPSDGVPGE